MRRTVLVGNVLAMLALTAGCSSSSSDADKIPAATTTTRATPVVEPFHGMSNSTVLAQVEDDVDQASSVHVTSWSIDDNRKKTLDNDFKVTRSGTCSGFTVVDGSTLFIRRIGPTMYVKSDHRYWSGYQQVNIMANHWIKVRKGWSKETDAWFALTRPIDWAKPLKHTSHQDVAAFDRRTGIVVDGVQATALTDMGVESPGTSGLFFSSAAPHLPVEYKVAPPDGELLKFQDWNTTVVTVVAPHGAVDLATLQ